MPENLEPPLEVALRALHELRVHQIELEMQNEELRRTEEELQALRARYFDLYDLAPVGYFTLSEQGLILEANLTAAKLLGVARGALVKQPLSRFILPKDQDIHYRHFKQLLETGAPQAWELHLLRKDAAPFWARVEATTAQDADGASVCRALVSDVAERKRADEELVAAHRKIIAILESISDGFNIFDQEWRYIYVNPAAAKMVGKPPEELLGKVVWELWPHAADSPFGVAYRRAVAENITVQVEAFYPEPLNRWFEVRCYPSSEGLSLFFTDTTERRHAEERLRQKQKLESIGLLAGGIAHDFNNLLVGVIGNASLAREMLAPGHAASELLDRVVETGEQAAHLTRQMLAYSGKGRFVIEPLNLSDLIPEMSGLVQPSISKKIALQCELDPDLPPIQADRGQVQQVFMNLVLNAAEAIGSNAGLISVKTGLEDVDERRLWYDPGGAELRPGRYVCLEVRDTGCGMDEATRARIFEPFFSTKFTGRGLGLAAVGGIVGGHKGAIQVTSTHGKGTCFKVLFPAADRAAVPAFTAPAGSLRGAGTVLVVDDEGLVREMVRKALERYGYQVLLADSGLAAMDVCKRHPGEIALVVLDLSMPAMSGEETLPELRKIRPGIRVMVSSGYSEAETMRFFQGYPVSGFIQKPYTSARLAEKVKACLG